MSGKQARIARRSRIAWMVLFAVLGSLSLIMGVIVGWNALRQLWADAQSATHLADVELLDRVIDRADTLASHTGQNEVGKLWMPTGIQESILPTRFADAGGIGTATLTTFMAFRYQRRLRGNQTAITKAEDNRNKIKYLYIFSR